MRTRRLAARLTLSVLAVIRSSMLLAGAGHQQPATPARGPEPASPARVPASSLTRPSTPTKAPDAAGFLQRWLVLEPIKVSGQLTDSAVQATVTKEYFVNQFSVMPHDGDRVSVAGESLAWHAVDTLGYNLNLFHFAYALNKPTSNVLFWAVTVVDAPRDMPGVRLAIGSNAASIWWLNDQEVVGIYNDRQTVIDDGVSRRLTLKQGPNVVRAAIVNAGGVTDFCARFLDGNDSPVKGIVVRLAANGRGQ